MGQGAAKLCGVEGNTGVNMSPEAKAAMVANGWDKGYVAFGFTASEATVKVATALPQVQENVKWVTVSFDDTTVMDIPKDFDQNMMTPGSTQILGVKSELYSLITDGVACMPALAIDGQMYNGSEQIVKMLAIVNKSSKEVMDLVELSLNNNDKLLQACKHFGWCGMHKYQNYAMVNKDHYVNYGNGVKDETWEKNVADVIKAFFGKLEAVLAAKPKINGFFVGDSQTLADASLINWVQSFEGVCGLDVKKHYPLCYANWELVKATPPSGSLPFIYGFPVFCGYVTDANKDARLAGFDINKYWE